MNDFDKIKDDAVPSNGLSNDIIIRSSDKVDFVIQRKLLSEASPILRDMLRMSQPPPYSAEPQDEIVGSPPVLALPEDGATISALLQFHTHGLDKDGPTLSKVRSILEAARRYRMYGVVAAFRPRLVELGKLRTDALSAFAIACSLGLDEEAETLAPLAYELRGRYVPELGDMSAGVYYRVNHYDPR
ncbi:hypothetical protein BD311DRAFT_602080, partial [Dichomitus squalens]